MARLFGDAYASVRDPFLRRACDLAELGRGTTSPNPLVGCVIVRDGVVVGEGHHERAGGPHAEVVALARAGEKARGATVYVTLEPCNHKGRTGPCTAALTRAGVARVVIGMLDPNPEVAGGGAEALRRAGIDVEVAIDPAPFEELNAGWLTFVATGRPRIRVKVALTLDGRASVRAGVRAKISGIKAAGLTSRLRREADAIVVGCATLESDDPALTARDAGGGAAGRQPLRVVVCGSRAPKESARIFTDGAGPAAVAVPAGVLDDAFVRFAEKGVPVLRYQASTGLGGAFAALGASGLRDVLVETGPRLFTGLWNEDLIDELVVYHAGAVAGPDAPPLIVSATGDGRSLDARMRAFEVGLAGNDAVTVWRRR